MGRSPEMRAARAGGEKVGSRVLRRGRWLRRGGSDSAWTSAEGQRWCAERAQCGGGECCMGVYGSRVEVMPDR